MINLLPFAPSFERNNSQVPLKKQKVLIASRPSHSLVLTQAWDDRPANRQSATRGKVLVLRNHFSFMFKLWICCCFGRREGLSQRTWRQPLSFFTSTAFCFGIHCAYSYPGLRLEKTYMPSARRSLGRNDWRGVFLLCCSPSGAPQTLPPSPELLLLLKMSMLASDNNNRV